MRTSKSIAMLRMNKAHRSNYDSIPLAIFYENDPMRCKVIYELNVEDVVAETNRQLDRSANEISRVGFDETWAKRTGTAVYEDKGL